MTKDQKRIKKVIAWNRAHPEKLREYTRRYRAKKELAAKSETCDRILKKLLKKDIKFLKLVLNKL